MSTTRKPPSAAAPGAAPAGSEMMAGGDRAGVTPVDPVLRLVARTPVYMPPDAPLREVAGTMAEESIGVVLVRGPAGPAGIVSERDVVLALAEGADLDRTPARDVMTPEPASVDSGAPVLSAANVMLDHGIRHVVVTSGDTTVGLVSMRDVLAVLTDHAAER